jgi:hypothetical protein
LIVRGEAPTTVEAPFEDVTAGARNAIREVEELTGRKLLAEQGVITPRQPDGSGVDIFMSTSSAGGGLQMMVAGVVKTMTAESAQRAALGAGAIVMDTIAVDDGRKPYQKIQRIRHLRPDMLLVSGGIDGGTLTHVVEIAELISAADPRPRLGIGFHLRIVDNLRPVLEREVLQPAREEIHNLFMEHVMAQAPGYNKLMQWSPIPIMPTPGAVGICMQTTAREYKTSVIGVDIGGATTDVFSVFGDQGELFNRTVSANLGMSYSICNVLLEAGLPNIMRWVPFYIEEGDLRNRIRNKMIRPTTIPQTLEELIIEQAIAREALRLAFEHHKSLAVGLRGVQRQRTISEVFDQVGSDATYINLTELGILVGSGGVLSHAPRRAQSALMMLDSFQPESATLLAVDSIFMMPQLGILSTIHPRAAMQVFDRDCLIRLGTAVAPVGSASKVKPGTECLSIDLTLPNGKQVSERVNVGDIKVIPLADGEKAEASIHVSRHFTVGQGMGHNLRTTVHGGVVGVVLDCRGRPLELAADSTVRSHQLWSWFEALNMYPQEAVADLKARQRGCD